MVKSFLPLNSVNAYTSKVRKDLKIILPITQKHLSWSLVQRVASVEPLRRKTEKYKPRSPSGEHPSRDALSGQINKINLRNKTYLRMFTTQACRSSAVGSLPLSVQCWWNPHVSGPRPQHLWIRWKPGHEKVHTEAWKQLALSSYLSTTLICQAVCVAWNFFGAQEEIL